MDGGAGELPGGIRERLTLWARQHAWLHTTPRRKDEPGRKSGAQGPPLEARIEAFLAQRERGKDPAELDLPETGDDQCLLDWLFEAGVMRWTEGGPRGLAWPDLAAWQAMTQTALTPWQAATIHHLSAAYAASAGAALDPMCASPMDVPIDHDRVAAQAAAVFGLFARPDQPEET